MSDVLDVEIEVPLVEDASLRAAMLAGVGAKLFQDIHVAAAMCVKIQDYEIPDHQREKKCEELYSLFI